MCQVVAKRRIKSTEKFKMSSQKSGGRLQEVVAQGGATVLQL